MTPTALGMMLHNSLRDPRPVPLAPVHCLVALDRVGEALAQRLRERKEELREQAPPSTR